MSKNSYNRLTNAGMLLGILSAWLYQRAEMPHAVAIAFAAAAAILSVGTYLYDRVVSKSAETAEMPISQDAMIATESGVGLFTEVEPAPKFVPNREHEIIIAEYRAATQRTLVNRMRELAFMMEAQSKAEMERTTAYMQYYVQHNNAGRRLRYRFPADNRLMEPEIEMSPREAAACYKQIMRDIVSADDDTEWNFTVDAKGLRVSGKKHDLTPAPSAQMNEIMLIRERVRDREADAADAQECIS